MPRRETELDRVFAEAGLLRAGEVCRRLRMTRGLLDHLARTRQLKPVYLEWKGQRLPGYTLQSVEDYASRSIPGATLHDED